MAEPVTVVIEDDDDSVRVNPGSIEIDQPDGGVVVQFGATNQNADDDDDFTENLAEKMEQGELARVANELYEAVSADDQSRSQYLDLERRGIELLGIKLEDPRSSVADTGAAIDGQSVVTNPLLLEALLKAWANARNELLPAEGPCKVTVLGNETANLDDLAEAFEQSMNYYLTKGAPEYYPETSHMLLWGTIFRGSGFKKVYRCPMRRRPVALMVEGKDFIVDNGAKDLRSCSRITHRIIMRKSEMQRMMHMGAYRDTKLTQPTYSPTSADMAVQSAQGTEARVDRAQDQPYTVWETQCEMDLDIGFRHPSMRGSQFKNSGIPLPYLVTMDKDSREILALRRDWREDDKECLRKKLYLKYPYVPGPGFYGTGMLNILGNATAANTAAWREALDAGMYASFPGGFVDKAATRQDTMDVRLSPGQFKPIDTGGKDIRAVVTGLPYHDVTSGLMQLMDKIQAIGDRLGGSAEIPLGEGLQNVPMGTMLAQIEQATKLVAATHKDMHQAQAEEIDMLVDLFREHPDDFWRTNRAQPPDYWDEQKFEQALSNYHLVPKSDPNVPSHLHRIMKAQALVQIMITPLGALLNPKEVLLRALRAMKEDPTGLVVDPPPQQQPQGDPAAMLKAQAANKMADVKQAELGIKQQDIQSKSQTDQMEAKIKAAQLAGELQIKNVELQREALIHQGDERKQAHDMMLAERSQGLDEQRHGLEIQRHGLDVHQANTDAAGQQMQHDLAVHQAMNPPKPGKP